MKIHLARAFEHTSGIGSASSLGQLYLGFSGFLTVLQTQLGLAGKKASSTVRLLQYLDCLYQKDHGERFYHRSLQVDDWSVARQLLAFRDELYLAGWQGRFEADNCPDRLQDLADVETLAMARVAYNEGQYLTEIRAKLSYYRSLIEDIVLYDHPDTLPALWRSVLENLHQQGVTVYYAHQLKPGAYRQAETGSDLSALQQRLYEFAQKPEAAFSNQKLKLKQDGSVLVIKAQSKTHSAQLISAYLSAQRDTPDSTVLLAYSDENILEQSLIKYDFGRTGRSRKSSQRGILQLLPLCLQLLWKPLDAAHLLAFLQHPVNILPAFACRELADSIARAPGIGGQPWEDALRRIKKTADSLNMSAQQFHQLSEDIVYWLHSGTHDPETGIPLSVLKERIERLQAFFQQFIIRSQQQREQEGEQQEEIFESITGITRVALEQCHQLLTALDLLPVCRTRACSEQSSEVFLPRLELNRILRHIQGEGADLPHYKREVGAPERMVDPALLIDPVDELVWWNMNQTTGSVHSAWSDSERAFVNAEGLELIHPYALVKQAEDKALQAILNVRHRLVMVLHHGEEHHPLWDKIGTLCENQAELDIETIQQTDIRILPWLNIPLHAQLYRPLPKPKRWWNLENGDRLSQRDVESFSGLEAFIHRPYLWVLRYKAKISPGTLLSLPQLNQLKGTLTHALFEDFFNHFNGTAWAQTDKGEQQHWFNNHFDLLVQQQAVVLLQAGKRSELESFRETVSRALFKLLEHLKSARIVSVNMEVSQRSHFFGGELTGVIDMLLTREDQQEVVVDIKWGSEKYKAEELTANLQSQLAVYAYLRKQTDPDGHKGWPEQAYFIITSGNMLAQNRFVFPDAKLCPPEEGKTVADLWLQLKQSYQWRREQLKNGRIEVPLPETQCDEEDIGLVPPDNGITLQEPKGFYNDFVTLTGWSNSFDKG